MNKYVIAVLVENKPGVLTRVSSMFTRRGFNIDALTVGEIEDSSYSRITITITGDENTRDQFVSQMRKLFNVKKVQVLEAGNTISRELLLIKVRNSPEIRPEIMAAAEVYRGKIIDYAADVMSVEITGEPVKIDSFIELMKPMGILEMCRTGIVAIERGKGTLLTVE
ncbi:MAG: acetolactate synthase small subunit [Ruminococcaceae bacterium]|nr:acetolactate synthase small subunit [Oscillospiraceae bacterium]MBQ9914266.1 acetolactate synthase small subunit [Clostridia bacterium]